jgi:hypothetical protein
MEDNIAVSETLGSNITPRPLYLSQTDQFSDVWKKVV